MPTATYLAFAQDAGKRVQWLVELDLFRCNETYTQAPCNPPGGDAGDGLRCWYSFPTCQDPANYDAGVRTLRFCLSDAPWSDNSVQVYPYLRRLVSVPQRIDPARLAVFPEQVNLVMGSAYNPPPPDHDKGAGFFNTTRVGEFWRTLLARNPNYSGRPVRIYRGFSTEEAGGFPLADFEKIGPTYLLKAVELGRETVTLVAESPLAQLEKRQIPVALSEDNLLTANVDSFDDPVTVSLVNASEIPDPGLYTRNPVLVEIGDEILHVTARDTVLDQLTCSRGVLGTTKTAHTEGDQVRHVVGFARDLTGAPANALEVLQDLLEWVDVDPADVDVTSFDDVQATTWPDFNLFRIIRKPKKVAKLAQQIRDPRGIAIYINPAGKWAAVSRVASEAGDLLTDDNFVQGSVRISEDDEDRISRVLYFYDPAEDNAFEPDDFRRSVVVVDADLESDDFFGDVRERTVLDLWLEPTTPLSQVANIAQRLVTRFRFGVRTWAFALEVADATTINVGDVRSLQSCRLQGPAGDELVRPSLIVSKIEDERAKTAYEAVDVNFGGRYLRMGPDTMADTYDAASEADKAFGYWGDADNRVGTINEDGYIYY